MKITLKCIGCKQTHTGDYPVPELDRLGWLRNPYAKQGLFHVTCPKCGKFTYPAELEPDKDLDEADRKDKKILLFHMFSKCPISYDCNEIKEYTSACEQPVLSVRCLSALHHKLDGILDHQGVQEKRYLYLLERIELLCDQVLDNKQAGKTRGRQQTNS